MKIKYTKIILISISMILLLTTSIFMIYSEYQNKDLFKKIQYSELKEKMNTQSLYVYFYKIDCVPCSKFKKKLNSIISQNKIYNIVGINVSKDSNENIVEECKLNVSPTIIHYKYKKEVDRIEGNTSEKKLEDFFKNTSQ